jgi:hypothetical protein
MSGLEKIASGGVRGGEVETVENEVFEVTEALPFSWPRKGGLEEDDAESEAVFTVKAFLNLPNPLRLC